MKPLAVLLGVFVIALVSTKLFVGQFEYSLSGIVAMSAMLLFTAGGHFAFSKGMSLMIPNIIPFKTQIVYLTGIIEIVAAAGLLISSLQHLTAWLLILFFIAVLPANISSAIRNVDYQKATATGSGIKYLWFRIPLQILFILWTYFFAIHIQS